MDFNKVPVNSVQPDRSQVSQQGSQQYQQQPPQRKKESSKFKKFLPMVAAVLAVIFIGGGLLAFDLKGASSYIDKSKYQAVFLSNGQVYFGKLSLIDDKHIRLNDIYYLQVSENLQQATGDDSKKEGEEGNVAGAKAEPQLIKLGQEIHGPDDEMILNRDQVLFWENLKQDGTLSKTIKEYVEKQKN